MNLLRQQRGFSLVIVMGITVLLALVILGVINQFSVMSAKSKFSKTAAGEEALASALLPILSEENLCRARLSANLPFSAVQAGAPVNSTNPTPLSLSFTLTNVGSAPIGSAIPTATPAYFPQFGTYVGHLYFASGTTSAVNGTERSNDIPGLSGSTIWQGQVWAEIYQKPSVNGAPIFSNNKLITTNLYLWTKGGKILSCGIVKTPAQFCVDDLGGAKYVAGGNPPCVDPAFPCPLPGYYFMGYNGTVAQCSQSPANCNLGQTIVANGSGGTKCFTVP